MSKPFDPVYFLLTDDLEENLLALEGLLKREGLVMLKARSGPEALELLLKHDIALALLDVQMPGMDGFELAELMRGTERTRNVPIIFLTAGSTDWRRRFRGYEAGAVDFLQKPIEPDILRSKAEVFFDLYRQRQQVAQQRDELRDIAEENARLLTESREYSEALKDADRRKDEFLATLAHELRNPLAPIRNGIALLNSDRSSSISKEVRGMMDRQLTHLVRLIDDLLDVARVSQGKIELRNESITLQSVLQAAVETSQPLIDASGHTLALNLPQKPLWLSGDPTRLAQVVSNLLNNAAKYTPRGGSITLTAGQSGDNIIIAVSDNGVGIPAPMLPKIFGLFTQVEDNLERSQGGLGIGLALVKRLVEMHGGDIRADSPGVGAGSTFTLTLPLAQPGEEKNPAPAPASAAASTAPGAPLRVLVVDDNVDSATTTGMMLEMLGHEYTLAHDGEEALAQAHAIRPDVIMLDIGLPKKNGYEVCRALRNEPEFNDTVLIAQTGWGQQRDRTQAHEAGFDYHLVKPVDFKTFSGLIGTITTSR